LAIKLYGTLWKHPCLSQGQRFRNALQVESPADIAAADRLIFPGVGAFGQAMDIIKSRGYETALRDYIAADRPFLGICLGLQLLFDGSEESGGCEGLGIIPGTVGHFDTSLGLPVPHIGWNDLLLK
jgi:imidazole glycerol-phosphate synthase